jgi:DnaJ-class molecular chaperone
MNERERDVCPDCGGRGEVSFHRSYRTFGGGRGVSRSRTVLTCNVCDGTGRRPERPCPGAADVNQPARLSDPWR